MVATKLGEFLSVADGRAVGEEPFDFLGSRELGGQPVAETQATLSSSALPAALTRPRPGPPLQPPDLAAS
jgi:hypothetical protein